MSESDGKENLVVSGVDQPLVGTRPFFRRPSFWIVVAVVIVVVGAGAGWWYASHRTKKAPGQTTAADLNSIQSQAEAAAQSSGSGAGLNVYKQAIASAPDQKTKGYLEMYAASQALNDNKAATALSYALQADGILHSSDSSGLVGDIYKLQGDKTNAIKYYDLAAKEVNPHRLAGDGPDFYLNEAQALESGTANE